MNSFRFVMQGINAEIARQTALVEAGEPVVQETLHFDPVTGPASARCAPRRRRTTTATSRSPTSCRSCRRRRCWRPPARRSPSCRPSAPARYERDFGLAEDTAHLFAFEPEWGDYFERAAGGRADPKADRELGDRAALPRDGRVGRRPAALAKLVDARRAPRPSPPAAGRTMLDKLVADGRRPGRDRRARGPGRDGGLAASSRRSWPR